VAKKNAARVRLKSRIRGLVNFQLRNPIITNAEGIAMGLHVRDIKPSTIPVSPTRPEFDIEAVDFRHLKIMFHNMGSSNAKPYGVNGAVIEYTMLNVPPANPDALTRSILATRTPAYPRIY
jgi:hypothetical protein